MRSLLCHLSIFVSGCDRVDLCWNVFSVWFRLMYDKQHHKPTSANSTMHQDSPGSETGKPNTFGTQISMWLCNLITDFGCIIYNAAFSYLVLYEYSEYDNVIFFLSALRTGSQCSESESGSVHTQTRSPDHSIRCPFISR